MGACTSDQSAPTISAFSQEATPREQRYRRAIKLYQVDRVRSLTNLFNRNKQFSSGEIPLTLAAQQGHEVIVKTLIEKGADLNRIDGNGNTALHIAVLINDDETVDICLANGADVNIRDSNTTTPLGIACEKGYAYVAGKLLKAGAKPDTNYRVGARNGSLSSSQPALMRAVHLKYHNCVKVLLDNGADPNYSDEKGNSPIQLAVSNGDVDSTEMLLKSPKFKGSCGSMNSPLVSRSLTPHSSPRNRPVHLVSLAALSGSRGSLEVLLRSKCADLNVDSESEDIVPPLIAATICGSVECIEVLLNNGVDVDTLDRRGFSALQLAVYAAADTERRPYYCKYFSNVYRSKSYYDPGSINVEAMVKCAIALIQAGADVARTWERFAARFPTRCEQVRPSEPNSLLAEVLIQSFGFKEKSLSRVILNGFVSRLLEFRAYNLLKLLHSCGVTPVRSICEPIQSPRQLRDLCRLVIRGHLSDNVLFKVDSLPILSEDLKDYVIIMDIKHFSSTSTSSDTL